MNTFRVLGGDIILLDDGGVDLVTGEEKLHQDIVECLLVGRRPNGYGAGMGDLIGSVGESVPASITFRVISALETYQRMQSKQRYVTPEESLRSILGVGSSRDPSGVHTDYVFSVTVRNGKSQVPSRICVLQRPASL